ncbi:MAG: CopG family ribbon-helix-helix protein [Terriglobales bacterium]
MKTVISIPDDLFAEAERIARSTHRSRSRLFADAMREYLNHRLPDNLTEEMNHASKVLDNEMRDSFVSTAARRTLERTDW